MQSNRRQGIFWLLTIQQPEFTPYLPPTCRWIRGQLEAGESTGFCHWQIIIALKQKSALAGVTATFGSSIHAELSRSSAATDYVWKDDTCVSPSTRFELGVKPFQRNAKRDWESVWTNAQKGELESIPADVRVVSYRTLRAIGADYAVPLRMVRTATVFWGPTGTGKSFTAWERAGDDGYSKDPRSKFWAGYVAQEVIVVDEFRGGIDISHILRWLDPYPVHVEIKGSSRPLMAKQYYFTSNLHPSMWYPDLDSNTTDALLRRFEIVHLDTPYLPNII